MCVCCVAGEIVDPLTETMTPEITNSTESAPEEVSPAGPASPATTEMVAAVDSKKNTTVHLPAALPLGDKQVPHGNSPTGVPLAPWKKGMAPQMGFRRDNSPMGTVMEPAMSAEWQVTVSPSQQNSMAVAFPDALQRAAALTNVPTGAAGQEANSSPLLVFPNQTVSAATRSHTAFGMPQAGSQGGHSTSLPATGDAGILTFNVTLTPHVEMGRENTSWSEKYTGVLGSPASPGASPAPSPTPGPAMDHSEYASNRDLQAW